MHTATAEPAGDVLTPAEAARYLKIAERTLRRWVNSGEREIPHVRLSHNVLRFRRSALDDWLQRQEQEGASA